jgi:hypothetical protein
MPTKAKQISICKMVFHSKISIIMTMCDKINYCFAKINSLIITFSTKQGCQNRHDTAILRWVSCWHPSYCFH